ncbi:hypothetical protein IFM89_030812 [Coptis chinensis]|uniref:Uncharacterized protein n=1 Tax=Coptis chinensis TaxID=261450 RepID=A0A835HYA5_9MAGN|nr:hypothetical protein IFM89_030812 [Coptis chinensis]
MEQVCSTCSLQVKLVVEGQEKSNTLERGMISADIYIVFEASKASGIKIVNQREAASSHIFWHKEFNLESLGMLLYGPPGTGKTNGLADWENVRWKGTKVREADIQSCWLAYWSESFVVRFQ